MLSSMKTCKTVKALSCPVETYTKDFTTPYSTSILQIVLSMHLRVGMSALLMPKMLEGTFA